MYVCSCGEVLCAYWDYFSAARAKLDAEYQQRVPTDPTSVIYRKDAPTYGAILDTCGMTRLCCRSNMLGNAEGWIARRPP